MCCFLRSLVTLITDDIYWNTRPANLIILVFRSISFFNAFVDLTLWPRISRSFHLNWVQVLWRLWLKAFDVLFFLVNRRVVNFITVKRLQADAFKDLTVALHEASFIMLILAVYWRKGFPDLPILVIFVLMWVYQLVIIVRLVWEIQNLIVLIHF